MQFCVCVRELPYLGFLACEKADLSGPVSTLLHIPSLCSLQNAHVPVHEVLGELPRGAKIDEVDLETKTKSLK